MSALHNLIAHFLHSLVHCVFSLTQQQAALPVVDYDHSILKLGRQVEGELGFGQVGLRRRNLSCHVVHDVPAIKRIRAC